MPVSSGIMAVDEQKLRRSLHERLESALGAEEAALLMNYLPPVGWADVARKADLDHLAVVTKRDLDALHDKIHAEIADVRTEIANLKSSLLMWMIPTTIGSIGVAVTLARI
jgi:hypothetical protein